MTSDFFIYITPFPNHSEAVHTSSVAGGGLTEFCESDLTKFLTCANPE